MVSRENWSKTLICPLCGREGVAWLSHPEDSPDQYETRTVVDECPDGFEVRGDEDDPNIFRFYCAADGLSADQ